MGLTVAGFFGCERCGDGASVVSCEYVAALCDLCSKRKEADDLRACAARVKAGEAVVCGPFRAVCHPSDPRFSVYLRGSTFASFYTDGGKQFCEAWAPLPLDDLDSFTTLLRTLREIAGAM